MGVDIAVIASSAGTTAGIAVAAFMASRRVWKKRFSPMVDGLSKALMVVNGREAVTLPENPDVELAPAIPGALERLEKIESTCDKLIVAQASVQVDLKAVRAEVQHNGGGSIKDAVKRIEESLVKGEKRFDKLEDSLAERTSYGDEMIAEGRERIERIEKALDIQP